MTGHFTVVVEIKETVEPAPIEDSKGYAAKGLGGAAMLSERRVIDRLRVVVSAEDQADAIARAISMLASSQPLPGPHVHRASCDDLGGNLVCGYPAGPSIASAARA